MSDSKIIRAVFDEDPEIIAEIDRRAALEGATRSALLRRFVRLGLFGKPIDAQAAEPRPGSMLIFGLFVPESFTDATIPPAQDAA